jgi:hypothetical protein
VPACLLKTPAPADPSGMCSSFALASGFLEPVKHRPLSRAVRDPPIRSRGYRDAFVTGWSVARRVLGGERLGDALETLALGLDAEDDGAQAGAGYVERSGPAGDVARGEAYARSVFGESRALSGACSLSW